MERPCTKRKDATAGDGDGTVTNARLPWPAKVSQCDRLRPRDADDCGSAVSAIKGYCVDRNLPTNVYRPVGCGGGGNATKFRLSDLVDELHRVFAEDRVNVEYVQYLMESYKSDPAEWLKYAKFNKFRYTRNLVDAGNGKFNLMVLCWGEAHGSSIHNHPQSDCIMKVLAGNLTEVRFAWPEKSSTAERDHEHDYDYDQQLQPMCELGRTVLETDSVCHING
jgi:cysteine dioxygenase